MDKGRIGGIDITVEKASEENGYVELTPEAEQNSWAMIGKKSVLLKCLNFCVSSAAGRNLTKQGKPNFKALLSKIESCSYYLKS